MTKILYHPKFEPSESWLRAMLLFYDSVHSIVPKGASYAPSPGVDELRNKVPTAFDTLVPTRQDLEYEWSEYHALHDVLGSLSSGGQGNELRERQRYDRQRGRPRLELGGGVRVHAGKMAEILRDDLIELGLAVQTEEPNWLQVDRRVADLVLSMLANRIVMNRSGFIGTASDHETSFAVAAKGALNRGRGGSAEATLASAILRTEIPADISELPLDRYLDIRNRYAEHRESFRLAMDELQRLYLPDNFQNTDEFQTEIESVVAQFGQRMQELRQGRLEQQVQRWAPVAIGGIVAVVAAVIAAPIVAVSAAGVGIAIQAVQTAQGERPYATHIAQTQALLVKLDRDLNLNRNWLARVFH